MAGTFCGNPDCRWSKERRGGRFHFRDGKWLCEDCVQMHYQLNPGKNLWSFETMHISNDPNRGPVEVKSLNHLRQLEKQHGVVSVAANFDSNHFAHPEPVREKPAYISRALEAAAELRARR